jgi:transcriptional regulator with GAF, ATPase, and Fis domain
MDFEKQSNFEKLISRLSADFINIPFDQIDGKIADALKRIVETLDIDRSLLHEFTEDQQALHLSHYYVRPGINKPTSTITSTDQPYLTQKMLKNEIIWIERVDDLPAVANLEKKYLMQQGVTSALAVPLIVGQKPVGALTFTTVYRKKFWPDETVKRLKLIGEIFTNALDRKKKDQALHKALSEIKQLKNRLQKENIYLKEEIQLEHQHVEIIGKSNAIRQVLGQAEQVAVTGATVLISGETGTGKELLAKEIHKMSPRKDSPLVKVNCAALPATLVENELFGREKGAYTGALSKQMGRFELADGASIFLDEIGELPLELQTKLLRVLQDGQFERLGGIRTISVDVRIIAATNRDLEKAVQTGRFRQDLYYRLNVFPIKVPPLRKRPDDIPELLWSFVREFGEKMGKKIDRISQRRLEALMHYRWPGNVRELRNLVERAMILSNGKSLQLELPKQKSKKTDRILTLSDAQRQHIVNVLEMTGWRVSGEKGAADILDINPKTLESRMKKLGITRKSIKS